MASTFWIDTDTSTLLNSFKHLFIDPTLIDLWCGFEWCPSRNFQQFKSFQSSEFSLQSKCSVGFNRSNFCRASVVRQHDRHARFELCEFRSYTRDLEWLTSFVKREHSDIRFRKILGSHDGY